MPLIRTSFSVVLVVAAACGVKSVGDLDDTSSGGDSSGSDSSASVSATGNSSTATSDSSTSVGTSVGTSATSDSGDSGTDSGECPPAGSVCDPQEVFSQEAAAWVLDDGAFVASDIVDVTCNITEFTDTDTEISMVLECDEGELSQHKLVVPHNDITPFNLGVGTSVVLNFKVDMPFWTNQWFALHTQGGQFIIGGISSSELWPTDASDLFSPVQLEVLHDVCEIEPECGQFCGPVRRDAISASIGDSEPTTIYDGNAGSFGGVALVEVVVGEASESVGDTGCKDAPGSWYAIIAYDSSEG